MKHLSLIIIIALTTLSCTEKNIETEFNPEGHWKWVGHQEIGSSITNIDTLAGLKITTDDSMIFHCRYIDSTFEGMKWRIEGNMTVWATYTAEFKGKLCMIDEDNSMTHYFEPYTQAELEIVKAWGCFP